jgi:magnesium chelatase family protein
VYCRVISAAIVGIEAEKVTVEADASTGMPVFEVVGHITSQVKEAQARVRTALRSAGIVMPPLRITVNLSPGDIRKDGTRFDLPIAAAVLGAIGRIDTGCLSGVMVFGELHLDGTVGKVPGVLPGVLCARAMGMRACIVPAENLNEAGIVHGITVIGIRQMEDLLLFCENGCVPDFHAAERKAVQPARERSEPDFSDIRGQPVMKRCALIAAAGFHNLLITGPPGAGKSMAARRLPGILPELTDDERLEISRIYSIAGLLSEEEPLMRHRPFRAPHHSLTSAALCGGGKYPGPGEITLAHRGVLFLDELPEMKRGVLEMLRQPLEDRFIRISRLCGSCIFPASFLLVAAMNPCPCGYYPDRERCSCTDEEIRTYRSRISHAFMDRIDLQCAIRAVSFEELTGDNKDEITSEMMRRRVEGAAEVQKERFAGTGICFNSEIPAADMDRFCPLTPGSERLLRSAFDRMSMSARGCHHVLRIARTIADLDGSEKICEEHISEAICYRI